MKKILISLVAVIALAGIVNAAGLTAPTIYGPTQWEPVVSEDMDASDTISGIDSLILYEDQEFQSGWEYAIRMKYSTADSCQFRYDALGTDGSTIFEQALFDTILTGTTTQTAVLPFGSTVLCNKATITALGITASKLVTFTRLELWRRKFNK